MREPEHLTEKALSQALEDLLEEKAFDEITIGDIAERSGLSRRTFYNHFKDVNDVAFYIHQSYIDKEYELRCTTVSFRTACVGLLHYMREHKTFYTKVGKFKGQNSLMKTHIAHSIERCNQRVGEKATDKMTDAILKFYWGGFSTLLQDWIRGGMQADPEELATVLDICMPDRMRTVMEDPKTRK